MKDLTQLREMTFAGLQSELLDLRKLQFNYRLKKANGTLDKLHLVKQVRRAISRVKTIMTEKGGLDL